MSEAIKRDNTTNELYSWKALILLILPLVAEQFLAVLVGMADTIMVSGVGESAVAAVSTVNEVNALLINLFSALSAGGSIVAAQYLGKRDLPNARKAAKQLIISTFCVALLIAVICVIFTRQIVGLLDNGSDIDTLNQSYTYLAITALSFPFLGLYNGGISLLRAMRDTKTSMKTSIIMNIINIGGNALLIHPCGMGVAGAATATLVSRAVAALIILRILFRPALPIHLEPIRDPRRYFSLDFPMIRRILSLGIPNGIENSLFSLGRVTIMGIITTFSVAVRAANGVCNSLSTFVTIPSVAVGLACIAVVGQLVGAGEKEQAKKYTRRLLVLIYCGLFITTAIMFTFARPLVCLFNLSEEAIPLAVKILRIYCVITFAIYPFAFGLPNALRAAGDARFTMIVSLSAMLFVRIACSYLFVYAFGLELVGIWLAMHCDWVLRLFCFSIRYKRGKWLEKKVV